MHKNKLKKTSSKMNLKGHKKSNSPFTRNLGLTQGIPLSHIVFRGWWTWVWCGACTSLAWLQTLGLGASCDLSGTLGLSASWFLCWRSTFTASRTWTSALCISWLWVHFRHRVLPQVTFLHLRSVGLVCLLDRFISMWSVTLGTLYLYSSSAERGVAKGGISKPFKF